MSYLYPYGDSQQLNLSWFLAKFKELYEYVMNLDPGESSMDVILSRFTDQYDPSTTYAAGDYCIFNGYIYKANRATSGMFDSGSWDPALPVNDIQGLRILLSQLTQSVEDLGEAVVTDVQYTPGAATADGLLRKTVNGAASTVMTVDKEPTENSQNPVKSGSVYEELAELQGSLNTIESSIAIVANGNTHAAIASGQYVYIKNHATLTEGLYKATTAIPLNNTLSASNVVSVSGGGLNDLKSNHINPPDMSNVTKVMSATALDGTITRLSNCPAGWYQVKAINTNISGQCQANLTNYNASVVYGTAYSPDGMYTRAIIPFTYFANDTVSFRIWATNETDSGLFYAPPIQ